MVEGQLQRESVGTLSGPADEVLEYLGLPGPRRPVPPPPPPGCLGRFLPWTRPQAPPPPVDRTSRELDSLFAVRRSLLQEFLRALRLELEPHSRLKVELDLRWLSSAQFESHKVVQGGKTRVQLAQTWLTVRGILWDQTAFKLSLRRVTRRTKKRSRGRDRAQDLIGVRLGVQGIDLEGLRQEKLPMGMQLRQADQNEGALCAVFQTPVGLTRWIRGNTIQDGDAALANPARLMVCLAACWKFARSER